MRTKISLPGVNAQGFTMIELMFAVTIIGILASIAIPQFAKYRSSAFISEAFMVARGAQDTVSEYYGHVGELPENNFTAGIPAPDELVGASISRMELQGGALHIYFDERSISESYIDDPGENGEQKAQGILTLRPAIVEGVEGANTISWLCGYGVGVKGMKLYGENRTNIRESILPVSCRK